MFWVVSSRLSYLHTFSTFGLNVPRVSRPALAEWVARIGLPGQSQSAGSEVWRGFTQSLQMDLCKRGLILQREAVPSLAGRRLKDYSCGEIAFALKQWIHVTENTRTCETSANRTPALGLKLVIRKDHRREEHFKFIPCWSIFAASTNKSEFNLWHECHGLYSCNIKSVWFNVKLHFMPTFKCKYVCVYLFLKCQYSWSVKNYLL